MSQKPVTELFRLIGEKWYLTIEELSKQSKVPTRWITQAVRGGKICEKFEQRLRTFLEEL